MGQQSEMYNQRWFKYTCKNILAPFWIGSCCAVSDFFTLNFIGWILWSGNLRACLTATSTTTTGTTTTSTTTISTATVTTTTHWKAATVPIIGSGCTRPSTSFSLGTHLVGVGLSAIANGLFRRRKKNISVAWTWWHYDWSINLATPLDAILVLLAPNTWFFTFAEAWVRWHRPSKIVHARGFSTRGRCCRWTCGVNRVKKKMTMNISANVELNTWVRSLKKNTWVRSLKKNTWFDRTFSRTTVWAIVLPDISAQTIAVGRSTATHTITALAISVNDDNTTEVAAIALWDFFWCRRHLTSLICCASFLVRCHTTLAWLIWDAFERYLSCSWTAGLCVCSGCVEEKKKNGKHLAKIQLKILKFLKFLNFSWNYEHFEGPAATENSSTMMEYHDGI